MPYASSPNSRQPHSRGEVVERPRAWSRNWWRRHRSGASDRHFNRRRGTEADGITDDGKRHDLRRFARLRRSPRHFKLDERICCGFARWISRRRCPRSARGKARHHPRGKMTEPHAWSWRSIGGENPRFMPAASARHPGRSQRPVLCDAGEAGNSQDRRTEARRPPKVVRRLADGEPRHRLHAGRRGTRAPSPAARRSCPAPPAA